MAHYTLLVIILSICACNGHIITSNVNLEDLPGYAELQGHPASSVSTFYYKAINVKGPFVNGTPLVDFYANAFTEGEEDSGHVFGRTTRVKGGETMVFYLSNNLVAMHAQTALPKVAAQIEKETNGNGFSNMYSISLHTHGIYGSPGLQEQPQFLLGINRTSVLGPIDYTGGDNIFINVDGKSDKNSPPSAVNYTNYIAEDHMPGMHWVHSHFPGMVASATPTANAVWIVEDDKRFLPEANGCSTIWKYLASLNETIMHFTVLLFDVPVGLKDTKYENMSMATLLALSAVDEEVYDAFMDFPNTEFIHSVASPASDICCNSSSNPFPFKATHKDFALLNGGYMPRIRMPTGSWQRWRMVNVAAHDFLEINIVYANDSTKAAPCDMFLYSKDGVYMMQIPRKVPALYLSPASRVEVLARCNGSVGDQYILASGYGPAYAGNAGCDDDDLSCNFLQTYLGTIDITTAEPQNLPTLIEEECSPLRPTYAADLRDDALREANAESLVVKQSFQMTDLEEYGCNINNKFFKFPSPSPFQMTLGTIQEISIQYANHHAFHIHVQPFQLVSLPPSILASNSSFTPFYKEGDWHDTLFLQMVAQGDNVTVRLNPGGGRYTGYAVAHCHLLGHEDEGCMVVAKYACPGHEEENYQPFPCIGASSAVHGTFVA